MRPITQWLFNTLLVGILLTGFLIPPALGQQRAASDPTRIGVGARPMGMGRAYIGLSDDVSSLFLNPAGIGGLKHWQLTSMQTKLLDEFNYLVLGASAWPTEIGVFGMGFVGAGININIPLPTLVQVGNELRIVPSSEAAGFNFQDNVLLLSYGLPLKRVRFLQLPVVQDMSVGANLKLFSVSLTGSQNSGVTGGGGSGMDLDLGVIYRPQDRPFSLGIAAQNALPFSLGGKVRYDSQTEETLPATLKIGSAVRVMGKQASIIKSNQELLYVMDSEMSTVGVPGLVHFGLEWWPLEFGAIRAGINQAPIGQSRVVNNFSTGVSLLFQKFRFDFSYNQFNSVQENNTYVFSLNYGVEREKPPEAPVPPLRIVAPENKHITDLEQIVIRGELPRKNVAKITVGENELATTGQEGFEFLVPLKIGKNVIDVKAFNKTGDILQQEKLRIIRLTTFQDVPGDYWAKRQIGMISTLGLVGGYPDGSFRPDGDITRAELVTLLVRATGQEVGPVFDSVFNDLPKTHWAAGYAMKGIEQGYIKGYPDGTFRPARNISRAEGTAVMARFAKLPEPESIARTPYPDISGRHWATKIVYAAKEAGLLKYIGEGDFNPDRNLTRAEAVEILLRTPFGTQRTKELMSFEDEEIAPAQLPADLVPVPAAAPSPTQPTIQPSVPAPAIAPAATPVPYAPAATPAPIAPMSEPLPTPLPTTQPVAPAPTMAPRAPVEPVPQSTPEPEWPASPFDGMQPEATPIPTEGGSNDVRPIPQEGGLPVVPAI